jgi:catechol 2,3-dioxygenase-like lactoylglutathione lyase family enzyme
MQAKLAHVCFESSDLEATEAFYGLLGLKRRFDFRNLQGELVGFYLAFDNTSFIEVVKTLKPKASGVIKHFAIEVDDVDAAYQRLKGAGVEVTPKEYSKDFLWMISCTDPNGIFIELQQYTDKSMQHVGGVCEVDYTPGAREVR